MIEKLETYRLLQTESGTVVSALPDTEMIMDKINEIIDVVNDKKKTKSIGEITIENLQEKLSNLVIEISAKRA